MIKRIFSICLILSCTISLYAQINYTNVIGIGGLTHDLGNACSEAPGNGTYVVGHYTGGVFFDTGVGVFSLPLLGNSDGYVARFDNDTSLIWAFNLSSAGRNEATTVITDTFGNAIVGGRFAGSVDFDPDTGLFIVNSMNASDGFVSKYDSSGNLLWMKHLYATTACYVIKIKKYQQDGIIIVGEYLGTMDLDPGPDSNMVSSLSTDHFLIFLDGQGNYINGFSQGGPSHDAGELMVVRDEHQNYYFSAYYSDSINVDLLGGSQYLHASSVPGSGIRDIYIVSYDASFNIRWAHTIGSASTDQICKGFAYQNGNIYIAGDFAGTFDADPGPAVNLLSENIGNNDVFILKFDTSGNLKQAKSIGGPSWDVFQSFDVSESGLMALTGYFAGTTTCDSTYTITSPGGHMYLALYDDNLGFLDAYHLRGVNGGSHTCPATYFINEQQVKLAGSYTFSMDFLDGIDDIIPVFGGGQFDAFIATYTYCPGNTDTIEMEFCQGDSVFVMGQWYDSTVMIMDTFVDAFGCNATVLYQLTEIPLPDVSFGPVDSIVCFFDYDIPLSGQPSGGQFSGPGVSDTLFQPNMAGFGTHTLIYTYADSNGCIVLDSVQVIVDPCGGIADNDGNGRISIYPNPFHNSFFIQGMEAGSLIKVIDVTGKLVRSFKSGESTITFKPDLKPGVYFIRIDQQVVSRVVKF